jgi:hypothetical protein
MLALPLLCGLMADGCLVLLPFRPRSDQMEIIDAVVAVISLAIGVEINRTIYLRRRGLIELRTIRHQEAERPAFMIPVSPHFMVIGALLSLLSLGLSFDLFIFPSVNPDCCPDPRPVQLMGAAFMAFGVLGTGAFLRWFLRSAYGLALLPEGVLLSTGSTRCFVAWDVIQAVGVVKRPLAGKCMALQVTDIDHVQTTPLMRHLLRESGRRTGRIFLWPLWGHALPVTRVAYLVYCYFVHPEERSKIGSEAELAELRAALAAMGSGQATNWKAGRRPS